MNYKSLLTFLIVFVIGSGNYHVKAQTASIGLHFATSQFYGDLNNHNLSWYKLKYSKPGGAITYQHYLNPSFNLVGMASYDWVQYQNTDKSVGFDAKFISANIKLKYKFNNGYIFKESSLVSPFLAAGLGGTNITSKQFATGQSATIKNGESRLSAVWGAGIFFRFNEKLGLEAACIANQPFDDEWDGKAKDYYDIYLQYSLGLIYALKKPADADHDGVSDSKDKCANTPGGVHVDSKGCLLDSDHDGVADYLDKCPLVHGEIMLNGCPDQDKDGVADINDKCPTLPGVINLGGCPDSDGDGVTDKKDICPNTPTGTMVDSAGCPLDSDGDNVPDNLDKCPNTPKGTVVNEYGCILDTDGDGVADNIDKCISRPGPAINFGCPMVKEEVKKRLKFATRGIYFETGKAALKKASYPMLDEIVNILHEYPDYNLMLSGHTDNTGKAASNMKLSQSRVDAVKNYLIKKGITESKLEAIGYGQTKPIASNKTATGRAQNRRVELDLFLK